MIVGYFRNRIGGYIKKRCNSFIGKSGNEIITNIFDYNNVIRRRPDRDYEVKGSSRFYGYSYTLKKYSRYEGIINADSEHGPALDIEDGGDYKGQAGPVLIVNSEQRVNFLKNMVDKPIFPIGPSIHYAKSIYNEFDVKVIKQALGKTLCIYPMHDIENFHYIGSTTKFVEYVRKIKEEYNYDTVLVSMYFVDIERGRHFEYEREGWHIVSAGRRENYDFNNCMKSIIDLADYAIVEGYASVISYCIYMGVPVTVFHKDFTFMEKGVDDMSNENGIRPETQKMFERMFEDYDENISREKYEFCNYWYGYDDILQPDELKLFFEYIERLKQNMTRDRMEEIAKEEKFALIFEYLNRYLNKN